ncbi:MMPL family transporter [Streptantibioticus ferralitis]|uniref:MMPL family transporter n=1 Tax=Streptantibioticus ferralitis TaxID=236510 RepID=A0ABT5Z9P6_9ACTN|nr:MMPL family transporter [Streptantibioticus ferralitis]MDF2260443.1 MMPL family transporter [Streptantibioticus ferralitis]
MFKKLAALASRRSRLLLGISLLFCVVAGGIGATVSTKLSTGGYDVPGSESAQASSVLNKDFGAGEPNLVALVGTPHGADDADTAAKGARLTAELAAQPGVQGAASYWSLDRAPSLRAANGRSALVLVSLKGNEDQDNKTLEKLLPRYSAGYRGLTVRFGGQAEAYHELNDQSQKDLLLAESIVTPITLILLILVFRGAIAAMLPLALGIVAIIGALAVLRVLVAFTDVSVFAMNLTTALGLGLGIDYSLFVLTRYREELADGAAVHDAIATSLRTAGRTVLFSAVTVALSLSALLLFPMYFLRSFAYAGIAVVAFAALSTLVVLPALLVVIGSRIDRWALRPRPPKPLAQGFWYRLAQAVMRRPVPAGVAVVALLLVLGAPFLGIRFSLADARELPADKQAHQVQTTLINDYPARETDPILVVADGIGAPRPADQRIGQYAGQLSRLPGVARVDALTGSYARGRQVTAAGKVSQRFAGRSGTWFSVVPSVAPYSNAGQDLVREVRAGRSPWPVKVGGSAASFRDTMNSLSRRLPYSLAIIVVSTFALLFLLTGSVLMPLKALVLNMFSLTATFGAIAWVFQEGHLSSLLGHFTVTGAIVVTIPIMMFCVAFGLSMDYEVFLLSRIKEEYETTGDNTLAVARGLGRTGRLITAAALLIAVVMLSFLLSGITFMKLLGLGLALAVMMDATLVRGILVPAFMRLAGRANWWAPAPLARLHARIGLREGEAPVTAIARGPADSDAGSPR